MENKDVRWKQRFSNFETSIKLLEDSIQKINPSILEKSGIIQIYEFTFELAWKTLKDFLEERDITAKYPRDVIKEAFNFELIDNGDVWIDMLEKRNLMSHTYNEVIAEQALVLIKNQYFKALNQVYHILKSQI